MELNNLIRVEGMVSVGFMAYDWFYGPEERCGSWEKRTPI